ncbi:MAG: hypothetical protein A3G41_06905 [Elusimicrobia bacterium RIFCSPLOWO2_12_FULL_59_9]|nr:MAG: hypothetical protein A3G41_06905 [Elusimicrobia bacterium RIFCSPLOWO2_12_FULL_59_9]
MYEQWFRNPSTVARYESAPYAEDRKRFLMRYAQQGYAPRSLADMASTLLAVVGALDRHPDQKLTPDQVRAITDRLASRHCRQDGGRSPDTADKFRHLAIQWLRFVGRLRDPIPLSASSLSQLDDFSAWMERERGLSPITIWRRYRCIRQFLRWYEGKGRPISDVQVTDIDGYLAQHGATRWSRVSVVNNAGALKAFFRFAGMRGWCHLSIADAIRGPRLFSREDVPSGPSWEDVQRLIASLDTERPRDIRDRPAVMLLAIYGLRVGEVSQLKLEDIDWERDQILIRRPKLRRAQTYPLVTIVGNAILRYLRSARPRCQRREVFLSSKAPFQPVSQGALYETISQHTRQLGIFLPHRGPHALRHACATHLLAQGCSLKEIGDLLGHRSSSATRIYAKVDMKGLREVATFDLGGLL